MLSDPRKSPPFSHGALFILILFALIMASCRERINPNQRLTDERESWLFCNYTVRAPEEDERPVHEPEAATAGYVDQVLHVLAWDRFIPSSVLSQFADQTGARVEISTYDNTTELHERLRSGENPELILTASFMAEQLHDEGVLAPLDRKLLSHLDQLAPNYQHPVYDPGLTWCVPYLWATMGIAYNYNALDRFPRTWGDLLVPEPDQVPLLRDRVCLLPAPQRVYGAALLHLGFSINTQEETQIAEAARLVSGQDQVLHFKYGRRIMIEGLSTGELLMAQAYSNEVSLVQVRNPGMRFCLPEDGTWVTHHVFVLTAAATPQGRELAEVFVNFLLNPTVAADVVDYSFCASTIPKAQSYISASLRLGPTYMLPADASQRHLQGYTPKMNDYRNRLWRQLTAGMPLEQL